LGVTYTYTFKSLMKNETKINAISFTDAVLAHHPDDMAPVTKYLKHLLSQSAHYLRTAKQAKIRKRKMWVSCQGKYE